MTGFDETVPPDDTTPTEDATSAAEARENEVPAHRPEHDSATPAFEDDPQPDEPDPRSAGG